jgi:hypothetical protein
MQQHEDMIHVPDVDYGVAATDVLAGALRCFVVILFAMKVLTVRNSHSNGLCVRTLPYVELSGTLSLLYFMCHTVL